MSRTAGMVFTGTVLTVESHTRKGDGLPTIRLTFKVGRAIAGVRSGQILIVREWAGAWAMHHPMHVGDHLLLFLYRPSKLGLTSPVSGSSGQVALDATGTHVAPVALSPPQRASTTRESDTRSESGPTGMSAPPLLDRATVRQPVTVLVLERAIRAAREH